MSKVKVISGFPEWLPEDKRLEDAIVSKIRAIYESHGFTPIETPAVEYVDTLVAKGVVDKEIYALRRLATDEAQEAELGLHFDLTVPFARYVATHFNDLVFPFKRYQLQKVWRGERPQKGRFREFYQFDVDIVARDVLPLACDAEVITILAKALLSLNIGTPLLKVNNRKLLKGFYQSLELDEGKSGEVITIVDKMEKLGAEEVTRLLVESGISSALAEKIVQFSSHKIPCGEFSQFARTLQASSLQGGTPLFEEGVKELIDVIQLIPRHLQELVRIDLQIARGLDYYTGTIVESAITEYPEFGSVGSGGRYEDLVSRYLSQKVPGVGVSLGLTRIMDLILKGCLLPRFSQSPAEALITVLGEELRPQAEEFAEELRKRGVLCEVYYRSPKLGKQIEYASKKGIPFAIFLGEGQGVKNLRTGEQVSFSSLESLLTILRA